MRTIARHEVDATFAEKKADELAEDMPAFVDLVKRKPRALGPVMTQSLEEAGYRCVTDQRAAWSDTWSSFALAMQASSAIFAAANQADGEVEFRLKDEVVRTTATGPTTNNDAVTWLDALYLAMVCRERARVGLLAAIPVELLSDARSEFDEYVYSWVRTWQAYLGDDENLIELVLETMRGADPAAVQHSSEQVVLQIDFPLAELFYHFTQRDEEKFNEALANALELHKQFWTRSDESRLEPRGFIALGPLAIACLARDSGMGIDVESEYLPKHLLEGTRVGELTL